MKKVTPLPRPPSTAEEIIRRLPFDESTLHKTVQEQANLYVTAAKYRARCLYAHRLAEIDLTRLKAELSNKLRSDATVRGVKVSEARIKEAVTLDPVIHKAELRVARAEELKEWAYHLLEAVGGRRESARVLASILSPGSVDMTITRRP